LPVFFFQRLYEFLGYFGGEPDGSTLSGYDALSRFMLIPTIRVNIIYGFRIISTLVKENNTLSQNLRVYLHTDSAS